MTTGRQPAATAEKKRAETQLSPAGERQKTVVVISWAIRSTSELFTAQRQMYASRRPLEEPPRAMADDRLRIARAASCSAFAVQGLPESEVGTIGRTITSLISPLIAAA